MKLVYFMRKPNLVGKRYSYQGTTSHVAYKNKIYFEFIISDEVAEWVELQSKTHYCILKYDILKNTLNDNGMDGDSFVSLEEYNGALDLSSQPLEILQLHIDYTIEKAGVEAEDESGVIDNE